MRPTGPRTLVPVGLVALVAGYAVRPISIQLDRAEPVITLWSVIVLWLFALAVAGTAWRTWRVHRRQISRSSRAAASPSQVARPPITPGVRYDVDQSVNRLLLAKATAITGAVVLGGYAGFAIAHLGIAPTDLGTQRLIRSGLAALGGVALVAAGLLLEWACRVPRDPDRPPSPSSP